MYVNTSAVLDYADDIALFADMIKEVELLLHKVESASKSTGLFLNRSKTKCMHINPSANDSVHSSGGSQIEKVDDFKYGTYTIMLQKTQNVSWRHHMTNHHRETTAFSSERPCDAWKPDGPRRRGRPKTTLQNIPEKDTNLSWTNLLTAMKNRNHWKEIIMSPH